MSKGINLIESEKKVSVKPASGRLNLLRSIAIAVLFSTSAISIILFILILLSPLPALKKQEENSLAQLAQSHPDVAKLLLVEDRLKSSNAIISKRTNFDELLNKVLAKIQNGLVDTALNLNKEKLTVTVTSNSLQNLDLFLNNLVTSVDKKEDFSKITLVNFITNETGNQFTLTVDIIAL
jgi:hypothetical protein